MRARTVGGMLSVVLVAALACNSGGGGNAATPPTASAFCQAVASLNIEAAMRCYGGQASDWPIVFGSPCAMLDEAVTNHHVTYDATKAAACLDELARPVACSADSPPGPSCVASVLVGSVGDGQPCESNYACPVNSVCAIPGSDVCSMTVCQHVPGAGDACDNSLALFCGIGSSCSGTTCVADSKAGAPCDDTPPFCGENLHCTHVAPRTCQRLVEGGPCVDGGDCFGYQYCDSTKHCHAQLPLGADCSGDPSSCQSFTACDPITKVCVAASHVGQLCGDLLGFAFLCDGGACMSDANQVSHCVVPAADGAPCAEGFECGSGACAGGVCVVPLPNDGAPCTDSTLCASGECSTDGLCADGTPCEDASLCTSGSCSAGICVPRAANGAGCGQASDCMSGACSAGMCVALLANGAGCGDGSACASGHCASGACAACP